LYLLAEAIYSMFEEPAGCKQLRVAEVMAVRHSEAVIVALRGHQLEVAEVMAVRFATVAHHQTEKLDTYAAELNVPEVRPRREVEKKEIVGEELKLMKEYNTADS
jgi:hypothetical protein